MNHDAIRRLLEAAGRPTAWDESPAPPLGRVTLARILWVDCAEQGLAVDAWESPLSDVERVEIVQQALSERLGLWGVDFHAPGTFGGLVVWAEGELLAQWRLLTRVTSPDDEALAATVAAASALARRPVAPDTPLATLVDRADWQQIWRLVPEPWNLFQLSPLRLKRLWGPTLTSWGWLVAWLLLGGVLLRWEAFPLAARLFFWGVALLFVLEYGVKKRQVWTDTPATWAADLADSWRTAVQDLEKAEADFA